MTTTSFFIHYGRDNEPRHTIEVESRERPISGARTTQTGYGRNMPTNIEVKVDGRWRRVRMTCYGNSPSFFIGLMGKEWHSITSYQN